MAERGAAFGAAVTALFVVAGCASDGGRAPAHEAELARARASIEAAARVDTRAPGGIELNLARAKLAAAEDALRERDKALARRLAVEAQLDAELAAARARSHEIQLAVAELHNGIRTLQDELRRNEQRSIGRLRGPT